MKTIDLSEFLKSRLETQGLELIGLSHLPKNGDRLTRLRTLDSLLHDWDNDFVHRDEATIEVVLRIRKRPETAAQESPKNEAISSIAEPIYLPSGELNSDYLLRNIRILMENKDFQSARKILSSILKTRKTSSALLLLAQCDLSEGRMTDALKNLQDSIAFQPTFDACIQAAQLLGKLERHAEAERYWTQAQKMKPQSEVACIGLAKTQLELGQLAESQFFFESALASQPRSAQAYEGLGLIALRKREHRAAHDHFARALEIQPNLAKALTGIVTSAYAIKSFSIAAHYFEHYVNSSPITPDLLYTLASLQFQLGRISESRSTLERVLMLKPGHSLSLELMKHLGI